MKTDWYFRIMFSVTAKACLSLAAALALIPSAVEGQCPQWDVSGRWNIVQGPTYPFTTVVLNLEQKGSVITGTASYITYKEGSNGVMGIGATHDSANTVSGTVAEGYVEGQRFVMIIAWQQTKRTGQYIGVISPDGLIKGGNYGGWRSSKKMKCAGTKSK